MPSDQLNQNNRNNQLLTSARILHSFDNSIHFISTHKFKMSAVQLLLTALTLIQTRVFVCDQNLNLNSINGIDGYLRRINSVIYFLVAVPIALNMSSRLDDAMLDESEFRQRLIENETLAEQSPIVNRRERYNHPPAYNWVQLSNNQGKIIALAAFVGLNLLLTNSIDAKDNLNEIVLISFLLKIAAGYVVTIADRYDNAMLTSTAYTNRHTENFLSIKKVNTFFTNVISMLPIQRINNDADDELEQQPVFKSFHKKQF
jgi:hypothetical protein